MSRQARPCFLATVLLLCGCMAGCPKEKPEETEKEPEPWRGEFKVVQGSWKDLKQIIEQNKGKVIVADLWTTWSKPSIRELPHLAELQKKYPDRIVCIAVNMDHALGKPKPSEDAIKKMEKILRDRFGTVLDPTEALPAFRFFVSTQADESFAADGKFDYVRSILIYDKNGKRTVVDEDTTKNPEIRYEKDVIPVVKKLLGSAN